MENIQRKDLSPIEEAKSYKKLLDRGYLTQDQLASRMGKAQATISNKLRLLNLDEEVQNALLNNKISERHARSLLRIEDKELQKEVLKEILENRLNVRDTENLISEKLGESEKEQFIPVSNLSTNTFDFPEIVSNSKSDNLIDKTDELLNSISIDNITNKDDEMIEVMDEGNSNDISMDKVVEKIDKLVEEIRNMGFDAKIEKYDFDELYQFVIKVQRD